MFTFISKYYDRMFMLLFEHLVIVLITVVLSLIIAIFISIFIIRIKWLATTVLAVLGVIYSIPSLALFAMLIPFVGIGMTPAIIALVSYNQIILVRNIIAGFDSIDPSIIEAAEAMGLNKSQLFVKIELPLALPYIIGGIRLATVSTIGIATIAALINAGGLGVILFEGLRMQYSAKIIWGIIFSASLSFIANELLSLVERRFIRKAKGEGKTGDGFLSLPSDEISNRII